MSCLLIAALVLPVQVLTASAIEDQPAQAAADETQVAEPGPTATILETDEARDYVEDEAIVTFAEDTSLAEAETTLSESALFDAEETCEAETLTQEALDGEEPVVVSLADGVDVEEAELQAASDPRITSVQPNYIYRTCDVSDTASSDALIQPLRTTNDPLTTNLKGGKNQFGAWQLDRVNAFSAWDTVRTDSKVTVGILDTGCLMSHEDLSANVVSNYAYDAVQNTRLTRDIDINSKGGVGHGTHVAGIIAAAANNGRGTAGISYNAQVLPVNIFYWSGGEVYATTSTLCAGYRYLLDVAAQVPNLNLRIVNLSLGIQNCSDPAVLSVITDAYNAGIVTVAAGGNSSSSTCVYPADYGACISVTGLSTDGKTPASWSDYNKYKDICAPGEYVTSTVAASSSGYGNLSGTSQAAPVVSGTLALLFALYPSLTIPEAKAVLYATADTTNFKPSSSKKNLYGAGVLDAAAAVNLLSQSDEAALQSLVKSLHTDDISDPPLKETGTLVLAGSGAKRAWYRVTGSASASYVICEAAANTKGKVRKAKVPAKIKIFGKTYTVRSVAAKAFKGENDLKEIRIGKNVRNIGKRACRGCSSLTKVVIGKSVRRIAGRAFAGCKKLKNVKFKTTILQKLGNCDFKNCKKLKKFTLKSKKLKKKSQVKKSLKKSSIQKIKTTKKLKKRYRRIFTKKNCGRKVAVKA
ncbi:MAG: S8 family serine peptidase [Coriobacteriaceae bacterium]|nr:S8 family serine peptidase [Coriobacteriaceae bacterium]